MNRPCLPGIAFLYEGGVPVRRIRAMTGHGDAAIYQAVDHFGLASRNQRQAGAPFCLNSLRRRYEAGATTLTLAEQYECDQRTIAKYLRQAGTQMRSKGAPPRAGHAHPGGWNGTAILDESAIIQDYKSGLYLAILLRRHKISNTTLYKILRRNNVPCRRPQRAASAPKSRVAKLSEAQPG